ncbi:MAG TPA: acyltransferase family protein [Streptosporangiaceae bacterium]|nr:acyltransferase family protein [Streptosporangiaceae bacterium]
MPKPVRSGQRYVPGLDGLRALAVLAVIAYHEQFSWATGGLLGVGVFFTLSGYLITSLLLAQWSADGRLHLSRFWLGRARRLLPALFVMLAVVTAWVTVADRARLAGLRGAVAAAATYSSNWYAVVQQQSYFARFAPPGPLDHLWSLAVEEQFYLVWPSLLLLGLLLLRKQPRGGVVPSVSAARWLTLPTLAMAAASALAMADLYQPGLDPTRVYEGTDTRAFGLLIGAALAMACAGRHPERARRGARLALDAGGLAGLVVIGLLIWRLGQYSPFVYRGGLVLLSAATAAVVAAVACPGSLVGVMLAWRPLRWIGVRSYGIYLWHYPVIVLTTPARAGENLARIAAQIAASVVLAALSWRFVEEPVRHGTLGRLWARRQALGRLAWPSKAGGTAVLVGGSAVLIVACAGLASPGSAPARGSAAALAAGVGLPGSTKIVTRAGPRSKFLGTDRQADKGGVHGAGRVPPAQRPAQRSARRPAGPQPLRTSCRAVAHIGDSTSDGLVSPDYLPNPAQRITARYEDVGVRTVRIDISGGRSVVEVLPGQVNGFDAARDIIRAGFRGCWVIALGTDDTADVAAGSEVGLGTRIARMMSATRGEPVLWVNIKTLVSSGPYAEPNMARFDRALLRACARYPNLRIDDWAAVARRKWFISDGIHYSSAGYARRAEQIAAALARAFPQVGHSTGCLVR